MTITLASAVRDRIQVMDTYVSNIAEIASSSPPYPSIAKSIHDIVHLLERYLNLGELKSVSVKLSVQAGALSRHSTSATASSSRSTGYFCLGDRSTPPSTQSKAHRILKQLHHTIPHDTVEEIAQRILENRRITRTDQISLLNITLSHITLNAKEKALVDKIFDGLKLGILKVVD
jgi:hypothetical protein